MFGLDELLSGSAQGAGPAVVLLVALALGLRHATDPDHLVAVSTLVATEDDRRARAASRLGLAWGLGHATSLVALGLPFVLVAVLLPEPVRRTCEALVGVVIMLLAVRLYLRRRRGAFHVHAHRHGEVVHRHVHAHESAGHEHAHAPRSARAAYGIGVLHGAGGSAALAVLLLAGIDDRAEAALALLLLAAGTAVSMAVMSSLLGLALGRDGVRRGVGRAAPALAAGGFAFGLFYLVAAV